jgi:N-acetylglucosamine-6-phosphate deacetylase
MNEILVINNANIVLPWRMIREGYVVCENGIIAEFGLGLYSPDLETRSPNILSMLGRGRLTPSECDCKFIDAGGNYISAGFIDIHTHGAGGFDFMDNTVEAYLGIAETHAKYGTTSLLPTTLASSNEELFKSLAVYKKAKALNSKGSEFLGIHIEGPYFSHEQRGAQDPKYLRNPEPEEYNTILNFSDEIVRWSLAPELPGALEFAKVLKSKNILASIAHTNAFYEEIEEAYKAGFTHVTHLYSCMSTITRKNAFRHAGAIEAAYMNDKMTVEIIADGVHLPKSLLQFVYKFKGPDRIALCTDSMRGAGMPDGESILGSLQNGQRVIIEDGVAKTPDRTSFAGSVATADRLVRTMMQVAEVPLIEAVRMMTYTPACIIGAEGMKGAITTGFDADLVIFDENISVMATIIQGNIVYNTLNN